MGSTGNNSSRPLYHFAPAPPTLLAVCREIRNDATALYYGSHTLLITDNMFHQPKALLLFNETREAALQHVSSVRVVRTCNVLYILGIEEANQTGTRGARAIDSSSDRNRISFLPTLEKGGVELTGVKTVGPPPDRFHHESAVGFCCCTLHSMAKSWGSEKAAGAETDEDERDGQVRSGVQPLRLLGMTVDYARQMEDFETLVQLREKKGEEYGSSVGAKVCLKCRKVKTI